MDVADVSTARCLPLNLLVRRLIPQVLPGRVILPFKFPAQPQKLVDEFLKFCAHGLPVLGALCVVIFAIARDPCHREGRYFRPRNQSSDETSAIEVAADIQGGNSLKNFDNICLRTKLWIESNNVDEPDLVVLESRTLWYVAEFWLALPY